jgi:twitching motility protein PilT
MTSVSAAQRVEWSLRLAQSLVAGGYATEANLAPLLTEAQTTGQPLGAMLIARQLALPGVVVGALAQISQLQAIDLAAAPPSPDALAAVPESVGREYGAVGISLDSRQLVVAFREPPAPEDVQAMAAVVGYRVHPVLADPTVIDRILASGSMPQGSPEASNGRSEVSTGQPVDHASNQPVAAVHSSESMPLHIDDLLRYAVSVGASDLHLTAQMPACIRLHGAIRPIEGCPKLSNETIRDMVFGILPASQRERFEEERELDTSHSIAGVGRFRVNVSLQRGTVAAALRPIPHEMPAFDSLGIPDSIKSFTELRRGLVLVTGPTGSGKSTTLASLVDIINRTKPLHIVTVEDPIEFLHDHKRSIITQREIGEDTFSFAEALRRVLRQDPDVILVGELRDLETISTALTAAETGHLVFATLHTQDAPQTVDRIIDVFPTSQQEQIRVMLAATLEGVVTQQLILNSDGTGRIACCEVLVCTSAVRNLIRSSKTHQVYSLMQTGGSFGMQTMDQGLAKLVRDGLITESVAYDRSRNEEDLRNHLNS